jgi:predicted DNA-binding transcriptional regulator AlpA
LSSIKPVGESAVSRFRVALGQAEQASGSLAAAELPAALAAVEQLRIVLDSARLQAAISPQRRDQADRVLGVKAAAERLGRSESWLYREAARLPFTVRTGRGVGFSERGLEDFIRKGGA